MNKFSALQLIVYACLQIQIRNYGPTIRTQLVAESKGHQQVLWLFGEDQQLTEVGTMNLFVHWINENGGMQEQCNHTEQ